jgi:hypothetical protein
MMDPTHGRDDVKSPDTTSGCSIVIETRPGAPPSVKIREIVRVPCLADVFAISHEMVIPMHHFMWQL